MAGQAQWVVPSGADVTTLMSSIVQRAVSQDPRGANRANACITFAVEQIRSAIQRGGRCPLSLTVNSVPPAGRMHAVVMAVGMMVESTPDMDFALKGAFGDRVKACETWILALKAGDEVPETPTDPDPTTLPWVMVGSGGHGGNPEVDLSTDGDGAQMFVPVHDAKTNPPEDVTASSGRGQVQLSWTAPRNPSGVVTYSVSRSADQGVSYAEIATGLLTTFYADVGLEVGTYFYVVTAANQAGTASADAVSANAL